MTKLALLESKLGQKSVLVISKLTEKFGVEVDLKTIQEDDFTDVYGLNSGRSTRIKVESSNASPFVFTDGVDDTLVLNIDGSGNKTITFIAGSQLTSEVVTSINSIFSNLASTDFFKKITLKTKTSIVIDSTSTALTILGFTVSTISNSTSLTVLITNDMFAPIDDFSAGISEEAVMYDPSGVIKVGDIIELKRTDVKQRQFKVIEKMAFGTTLSILNRFKISPIEE